MLMQLKSLLNSRELMEGKFGIERECLRVNPDGSLALSPHPTAFGEKQFNPYITTDFSESQIEMITPTFKTLEEAHQFLSMLYDIVSVEVGDELLWPQSMPCFIKPNQEIPIAMFSDSEEGQKLMTYRESLLKKYGGKRQLISGLHYNFSFSESLLVKLFGAQHDYSDFRLFKDAIYLKVVRNYIRYRWLLIYLLGASPIVDESYCSECSVSSNEVAPKSFSRSGAISFRNSLCGYQNKKPIYVDYTSAKTYVNSLKAYIEAGEISSFKEFYSPIRLKAIRPNQLLESLIEDGIEYLEIRSIDLNPFAKEGITLNDLHFIQLFVLFLLDEEESNDSNWQEEANENERRVAVSGLDEKLMLLYNGNEESLKTLATRILKKISLINDTYDLNQTSILNRKQDEIKNPNLTLSAKMMKMVQETDYLSANLELARTYKQEASDAPFQLPGFEDLELSTQILMKEAIKRGVKFEVLDRAENFIKLSNGEHCEFVKQATKTSLDSYITILAMENKQVTKEILRDHHLNVPTGALYESIEKAQSDYKCYQNRAIVIKPKSTNFGIGISIFEEGVSELEYYRALKEAFSHDKEVIVEEFVSGKEYRFLVIENEVIGILHRVPANVIGDGVHSITELIELKNKNPLRGYKYRRPLEKIQLDEIAIRFLYEQGYTPDTILPMNVQVFLRENSNISTGGDSIDMTDDIHDYFKKIACEATKAIGAKICGVDMMIEDFQNPASAYSIIELNFNPAIHIHTYPFIGQKREAALAILKALSLVQ